MYLSAGRVRQWVHTDDRWCVSEMVSCLGQEVQGNCLNLELLLLFFGLLLLFLFNSPEWNEKGEGVKPRFIIKTFFAVLNFACADYFSCRHLYSQTRTYTFTHKTIHAGLTSQKKKKKYQRILNIERLLKRLFSSFFLSSRQVRWHSLPQTITSFSTHLSLHHAVLAQCFICLRYLQFWD